MQGKIKHLCCQTKVSVTVGNFLCNLSQNFVATTVLTLRNGLLDGCYTRQHFLQVVSFRLSHEIEIANIELLADCSLRNSGNPWFRKQNNIFENRFVLLMRR